jgi:hypothetical protein
LPFGTVDLAVDDSGGLYYLSRGAGGSVFKVQYNVHPWQNPINHADVDGQNGVVPLDALIVINDLNTQGARPLPTPRDSNRPPPYLDVNGDGHVAPMDALIVVNLLNHNSASE